MPKKPPHSNDDTPQDPAQQIWLAGLGAFSQAQKQGSAALQKMLQDGLDLQKQAQQTAERKIAHATQKMSAMAQQLAQGKVPTPANAEPADTTWGSLEGMFDQRMVQALQRLGWPTPDEWRALQARVTALEQAASPPTRATRKTPSRRNG